MIQLFVKILDIALTDKDAHTHTHTNTHTHTHTGIHRYIVYTTLRGNKNSHRENSMQPLRVTESYYPTEIRGSMRKPQRICTINLSVSFSFFTGPMLLCLSILLTDAATGLRFFSELQSYSFKALGMIWRSFLWSLTLRKKVSDSKNSNSSSFCLPGKSTQWLVKSAVSLCLVTSVVMIVITAQAGRELLGMWHSLSMGWGTE